MNDRTVHPVTLVLLVAAVSLAVVSLGGCRGREVGSLDQITIVKYRYSIDDSDEVVRVVGLARNSGQLPTPEGEIIATLRSRTGSFKGQNRVELPRLDPGLEQEFGIAIDSHGSVESVEIVVVEPGTVVAEAEDTPTNSEGEAPANADEEGEDDG